MTLEIIDEGYADYGEMLSKQRELFSMMVERKRQGIPIDREFILLVEHNPVITLGRHAKPENILFREEELALRGIEMHRIERGGDVTYHGPGQLVAYPILNLEAHKMGVRDYVEMLEEAVIRTLSEFGLKGERVAGASGVWIDAGTERERKICALGVKCSRYITMHGLALNVNTDLNGFRMINPCGFLDKGVTSMAAELHKEVDINLVKNIIAKHFKNLLGYNQ